MRFTLFRNSSRNCTHILYFFVLLLIQDNQYIFPLTWFPYDSVPEFAKVRHWTSREVNGQILVWFHCDGKDPEWTVPEQMEITKGEWVYRGRTEHFINAHIQVDIGIYTYICKIGTVIVIFYSLGIKGPVCKI